MNLEDLSNLLIEKYNVELCFIEEVKRDIKAINKGKRTSVLKMIIQRAQQGPLFIPDGVAKSLHGELSGFAKIKSKHLNTRVVYRPVEGSPIRMEIVAIGPRDKDKAYKLAAQRLIKFFEEMNEE